MKTHTRNELMLDQQLELGFVPGAHHPRLVNGERRIHRARWWFDQMRQVIERAMDWQPAPPFQPEQSWLPGANPRK